jgi:hypothetical protein
MHEGLGQLEISLPYPYEGVVSGTYSYSAEVHVGRRVLKTAKPVQYEVGSPSCFA